jgi:hypothetical protein
MSFSNPQEESQSFHPCKVWVEYKSKITDFQYWNKEAVQADGTQGARESLGANPKFIFLDMTFCVTGYNGAKKFGLKSNEMKIASTKESWANSIFKVESMPKEAMVIKFGSVSLTSIEGAWSEIKDMVDSQKGKLTINAYVAIHIKGKLTLACLQLSGSAYGPFKDFYDKNKGTYIHSKVIAVTKHESKTTGDNTFNVPVFEFTNTPVKDETFTVCTEMDKELQSYLKGKVAEPIAQYTATGTQTLSAPTSVSPRVVKDEHTEEEMFGETVPVPTEADFQDAFGKEVPTFDDLDDETLPF